MQVQDINSDIQTRNYVEVQEKKSPSIAFDGSEREEKYSYKNVFFAQKFIGENVNYVIQQRLILKSGSILYTDELLINVENNWSRKQKSFDGNIRRL